MVHEVYHAPMRRWLAAALLLFAGCHYDQSLTATPTRGADPRLVGTWTLVENGKSEVMEIRRYDDANYVIGYNGDLYRAFHSDAAGMPVVSVQNLNDDERKWAFLTWSLSDDGKTLTIRAVNKDVVPNGTREAMVKAIEANRGNAKLLGEPGVYRR